jgi:murein DD-endopeptidase MepM/ murein hydrolase activator NlpD
VSYTDPEIHASLESSAVPVMDYITDDSTAPWTAQGLGRELDALQQQLTEQKDWFAMLDLVLTRRAGVEARLPTYTPVDYPYLSSSFGWRRNPVTGRHSMHEGLDFAAPKGAPIHAASGGVVTEARQLPGYGKLVEIDHGNGLLTRYAHASSINVKRGDLVEKGHMIARVGSTGRSTGAHLHFEVRMAGHPLDPTLFLAKPQPSDPLIVDASDAVEAILPQVR